MTIYDSILYSSTFAANYYPSIFSVNITDGSYIMSNIFSYFSQSAADSGAFDILAADEKYIYGFISRYGSGFSKSSIIILSRQMMTPIKLFATPQFNFIIHLGINYYDALFRFIDPLNSSYVISMDKDLMVTSSNVYLNSNRTNRYNIFDYNERSQGDAYFVVQILQSINSNSSESNQTSNDQFTFSEIIYDPNGTNPNDVHWIGSDMNFKYLSNLSLFYDASEFANYTQVAVTS